MECQTFECKVRISPLSLNFNGVVDDDELVNTEAVEFHEEVLDLEDDEDEDNNDGIKDHFHPHLQKCLRLSMSFWQMTLILLFVSIF